jgi:hypothetical protein
VKEERMASVSNQVLCGSRRIKKKLLSCLIAIFLSSLIGVPAFAEPTFSVESAKQLDSWWSAYFKSGETKYIEYIIEYANTEDLMSIRLNQSIAKIKADTKAVDLLRKLQIQVADDGVSSRYELDTLFGILFRNKDLQDDLKYLYSLFPDKNELLIRCAVKSSAFWSLLANSRQHADVKVFVESVIPNLKKSSIYTFETLKNY